VRGHVAGSRNQFHNLDDRVVFVITTDRAAAAVAAVAVAPASTVTFSFTVPIPTTPRPIRLIRC